MKLDLSIKEIAHSYLHIMLETVITILGSTQILQSKVPDEVLPQIDVINKVSAHLWDTIQDLYRNPENFFNLDSASTVALQFRDTAFNWKQELQIISAAIEDIKSKQVKGFYIEDPLVDALLREMPNALSRSERYVHYLSEIKEDDFLVWDTERVRKIYPGIDRI